MFLPRLLVWVVLMVVDSEGAIATCFDNMPSASAPLSDELPLCGNGILDAGELCDDGNQIAGDGCNAFCSAFDAMPSTCTLAGQSMSCPFGKPQVAAPSQSLFCNLRAIDAGPDGTYVILADMGSLFRYNLYVDTLASSIVRFSASATFSIQPICSLAVLPSDETIMLHECENQRVRLVSANGQTATVLSDFRTTLASNALFRAYYDKSSSEGMVVLAANLLQPSAQACTQIWTVTSGGVSALLADIPCIVYNVWSAGIIYPSYSIAGMNPHSISKELCPRRMQQTGSAYCYSLAMQRDDMYFFYVFVHVEGGVDMAYQLNTDMLDNALGLPITRVLGTQVYTALGGCLTMESRILTSRGSTPPTVTLGNACRNVPFSGLPCATPLNNPYITDVVSSPYLLPQGLSATHTHSELSAIFSATCSQANSSGPLLYRSILQNVYGNTTPVDFVPLPNTQDIIYITSTTVGFISTKRTQLLDRLNHGYCRPNNLLYCPHGYFGSVGSVCAPCTDSTHPMYGKSVAWQIKCASLPPSTTGNRRLLLQTRTSPFEKMSLIVGADPKDPTLLPIIHEALKSYTNTKAVAAPSLSETFLTSMQQYNMAADRWTSVVSTSTQTLIECLLLNAENTTRRVLNKNRTVTEGAEFISTLLSYTPGQLLITAIFQPIVQRSNDTFASKCSEYFLYKDPLQAWLPCVALKTTAASPHTTRRLLQQTGTTTGVLIVEHQSTILASNSAVSWSAETQNTPLPPPPTPPPNAATTTTTTHAVPIWAAATVAGVGLVVLLFLVYLLYRYLSPAKKHSS